MIETKINHNIVITKPKSKTSKKNNRVSSRYTLKTLTNRTRITAISKSVIQYKFNTSELCYLYIHNPQFAEICNTRKYIYINGYICFDSTEYIDIINNKLTEKAQNIIKHCCIIKIIPNKIAYPLNDISLAAYKTEINNNESSTIDTYLNQFDKILNTERNNDPLPHFNELLKFYMKSKDCNITELAEKSHLSERTISRLLNDVNYKPSIQTVISICIALQLVPWKSDHLLSAAGYCINTKRKIDQAYWFIIHHLYNESLYFCNQFLTEINLPPLSKTE